MNEIRYAGTKRVIAITEVFPEGFKISAVAVEYENVISNEHLSINAYEVEGRIIEKVYSNDRPDLSKNGKDGKYVIIKLVVDHNVKTNIYHSGEGFNTKSHIGNSLIKLKQLKDIETSKQGIISSWNLAVESNETINLIVDKFQQFEYKGLLYNVYIPEKYDELKEYPMVIFMHDAASCSSDEKLTLVQGAGAVGFASDEEQSKHECFVLAPQFPGPAITDDNFHATTELELTKELIDYVVNSYKIDKKRIFLTGQSMGCMASCELAVRYPDFFAGYLLVAGQWNPETMVILKDKKIWILVSEGDDKALNGMNAVTTELEKAGAKLKRYFWNGKAGKKALEDEVGKALEDDCNIRYVILEGSSVIPDVLGNDYEPIMHHLCTWRVVYTIDGLKDWLFNC